jgi:histone acetyltransferase (RNA polymerase elongator complex component)
MLKDNCFKVDIHLMPDLPGADVEMVRELPATHQ